MLMLFVSVAATACGANKSRQPATDFVLTLYDRSDSGHIEMASFLDYEGSPIVLNFWATWCAPCRAEMPLLEEMHKRFQAEGLVMLGVDMGITMEPDVVTEFLDEVGVTYPVGFPVSNSIGPDYGIAALPATVFIDQQGKVDSTWFGLVDEAALAERISKLIES